MAEPEITHISDQADADQVVIALRAELGDSAVLTGTDAHGRAAGIWRSDTVQAKAIVRPQSTDEVSTVMRLCHAHNQQIVAHGGLTGLVASGLTTGDEIALSLERMTAIEEVHELDRTMVVQAGAVLQVVQETAEQHGLMFPLDLGARGSCTIGGNLSTNAGGNRVVRYGMARDMVLGLEVVLADGTVLSSMNRMIKNNAGFDLKQLFVGTEGSLGVITRAVLRLREAPDKRATMFVGVESFDKLGKFLKQFDAATGGTLSAFEVMWNNFYALVTSEPANQQPPLSQAYPYYVLVETIGSDNSAAEVALAEALEQELIVDAVLAQNEAQRQNLWAMRDDVEQCFRYAPVYTFDVSLRLSCMEDYVGAVNAGLGETFPGKDVRNFTFGHLGDGNLHFLVSVGTDVEETDAVREGVERCVYEPLAAIEGSISGEHGIGLEKKPWLSISRTPVEVALMRQLKSSLDPKGLLNRGKIFDV